MGSRHKYLKLWVCIFLVLVTTASHIQFHKGDHKRSYLVFESNATSKCNNIPRKLLTEWNFVKTDTCMMVYNDFHCRSLTSGRFEPGTSFTRDFTIYSFHVCNNHEGGLQLNLDFTGYFSGWTQKPRVLESYEDVCECINIPNSVHDVKYWSINNHGNELMAYYELNCLENFAEATYILDGHSYESRNIYHLKNNNRKVESVGPAKNSTYFQNSCLKLGSALLPEVDLSEEHWEIVKPKKGSNIGADIIQRNILALLETHSEEIRDLDEKTHNVEQKLNHFKTNLDQILEKHKQELQQFTDKIKQDLQVAYARERYMPTEASEPLESTTEDGLGRMI